MAESVPAFSSWAAPPNPRALALSRGGIVVRAAVALSVVLLVLAISNIDRSRISANEFGASVTLLILNEAQVRYVSAYKAGYAESLNRLGPSAKGEAYAKYRAQDLDKLLAGLGEGGSRFILHGYRFTYTPGPRDTAEMITGYTISARPLKYHKLGGRTGERSFFTDQSGVIRATREDRAATAADRPLSTP